MGYCDKIKEEGELESERDIEKRLEGETLKTHSLLRWFLQNHLRMKTF